MCVGDIDGNDVVGFGDLPATLSSWGESPGCTEDLDGDDVVDFQDLRLVLLVGGGWRCAAPSRVSR